MNRKPAPRRDKIGNPVIWTDYSNGTLHRCEILGYVEPGDDDYHDYDPDLNGNGPLYSVRCEAGQHGEMRVAEVDLSSWPKPSLEVVDGKGQDEP